MYHISTHIHDTSGWQHVPLTAWTSTQYEACVYYHVLLSCIVADTSMSSMYPVYSPERVAAVAVPRTYVGA